MKVLKDHKSWNSTGEIGRIGRHLAEKPDVEVTMSFGPMPPDASDFPGGIQALRSAKIRFSVCGTQTRFFMKLR